jgi:hypothetical protein
VTGVTIQSIRSGGQGMAALEQLLGNGGAGILDPHRTAVV